MKTPLPDEPKCTNCDEVEFLSRKLLDINKSLVESEKAKTRFLSLVANELNNPMTVILGLLPHLSPSKGDAKEEIFNLLQEQVYLLEFRIQNLEAAAEIESGIVNISNALVQPAELIEEALQELHYPFESKGMRIETVDRLEMPVVSDPRKLYMIIKNLLANAICYGNIESVIAVTIHEVDTKLVISVRNEGKGPDVEFKPQIFTRFADGPASKGLGIGLSIVRDFCERMGGSVDYDVDESSVVFSVTLPLSTTLPDSEACGSNEFYFDSFDDAIEL